MCGWYRNAECKFNGSYSMVMDRIERVYVYIAKSSNVTNRYYYLLTHSECSRQWL